MSVARVLGCWLVCTGCQNTPPAAPPPPISQVVVPAESELELEPAPDAAHPSRFSCAKPNPAEPTRVEFEVSSVQLDGSSAPARTRATYSVRMLREAPELWRAEVVLEALLVSSTESPQSGWSIALERGWIEARRAFVLRQHSTYWCFGDDKDCDDAEQREVARAIGETLELLQLPELVHAQLDGRPSDGSLRLELPALLLDRLRLGSSASSVSRAARQEGRGFPARFVTASEPPKRALGGDPSRVSARIAITQNCALASLQAELSVLPPDGSDGSGGVHRFSWRFEPAR